MNIHTIYRAVGRFFRTQRLKWFVNHFDVKPEDRILDVGGTPHNWTLLDFRPNVWLLNVSEARTNMNRIVGDGCYLPFRDNSFDIVFSNSVIEHLGTLNNQEKFAKECQRVGVSYYVQTPNKWFFIEPHFLAPFIHWLPHAIQRRLLRNFTGWGLLTRPDANTCNRMLEEIRLLSESEFRSLFPDATIRRERFLGMTKSLLALRKSV